MILAEFQPNRTISSEVMTKKFTFTGTVELDLGIRDFSTVEPGNLKSGYLTSLHCCEKSIKPKDRTTHLVNFTRCLIGTFHFPIQRLKAP